ncbi:alpha/beta fold hydrolase [Streptomyces sp. NPDC059373]
MSVLLVHGLGSSYEQNWLRPGWVDVLEAEGLLPRPVTLPGHGDVPLTGSPADAVLAAARDADGAPAGVGFSAGAIALLSAAAAEPGRFSRIVLLGVGDHVLAPERESVWPLAAALRGPAEPLDVLERTFWRLVGHSGNDRRRIAAYLESAPLGVAAERLAEVRCPVLVVVGDRDRAMPAEALTAALPEARLVVLPGVDHFATVTALAAFDAVGHFLTS